MNNDIWTTIASVFTGKGSTLRLAIFGSLISAIIYEAVDVGYNFSFTNKGTTVSLTPTGEVPQQMPQPESQEDAPGDGSLDDGTSPESQQA